MARRLFLIFLLCAATVGSARFLGAPGASRDENTSGSSSYPRHGRTSRRAANTSPADWKTIASGVQMRRFQTRAEGVTTQVVALRAAPSRLHIETLKDGETALDAASWRRKTGAIACINGGFFSPSGHSLGLRMSRGREVTALRAADWGVFYVRRGSARILHTTDWKKRAGARRAKGVLIANEAIQCGPRLVVAGRTMQLKPQWARRTGVGLQSDGRVVLAVTEGEMSFQGWAQLWASPSGLDCPDALNLDGGGSTQISVDATAANATAANATAANTVVPNALEIGGLWPVPDAVIIK